MKWLTPKFAIIAFWNYYCPNYHPVLHRSTSVTLYPVHQAPSALSDSATLHSIGLQLHRWNCSFTRPDIILFRHFATRSPRSFLAFSTLLIWIATILMIRVYRPVGMLLLLLTETMQGVFSYLALFFFIIIGQLRCKVVETLPCWCSTGFTFVPFLLLRNLASESNAFSSFPLTLSQMLNFISSDYGALEPFESEFVAVKTLRALYIIIITILFLNTLIALLNLKIKAADKNASNLFHLQMASLQVEIELGLLSSSERKRRDWYGYSLSFPLIFSRWMSSQCLKNIETFKIQLQLQLQFL